MSQKIARNLLWSWAHAERAALARDLADLDEKQWAARSLCGRWNVEEVVAHLTAAASIGPARWVASAVAAKFNFDLHNDRRLAEHLGATPTETLARFHAIRTSTTSMFGPIEAWVGEVLIHGQDIRHPLGIKHQANIDATTAVARFLVKGDFTVPSKSTSAGLRLQATDGPFTSGDTGPLVTGTTLALVMAAAGRGAYCQQLTGDGVDTLFARCTRA